MSLHQENVRKIEPQRALAPRSERSIGAILVEEGKLTAAEVERVLERQHREKIRFGEAAVRLGYITPEDVRFALAKQYDMPHFTPSSEGPSRELVAAFAPFHPRTEEMRALRTQLLIRWYNPEQGRKSLVVASTEAAEGRSYVAANLAIVFSQLGARTLLGLAAVFLLELIDRRVRSGADLETIEVPMLGSLQPWNPPRLLGGN